MLQSDEHALAVADKFYSAALGTDSWSAALEALAAATGSRSGELIAFGPDAALPIHIVTNMDPDVLSDSIAQRAGDPAVNPRVRAGIHAPVLKVLAENDFMTPEEHRIHRHYQEFARPWDIPYICLANLDRRDGLVVGLSVLRSERQGHISTAERQVFASLAPHVRAAVRMQMALEDKRAMLLSEVFTSLSLPAFVCDRAGRVHTMTPAAEAIVSRGHALQMKGGRLTAVDDAGRSALSQAVEAAADASSLASRIPRTVVIRSNAPTAPALVLDVIRLPATSLEIDSRAPVLIVSQAGSNTDTRRRALLQAVYKLTAAETDVALQLSQGRTAEIIAAGRGVAIATVRAQIKAILAKLGLKRQIELVAKVTQL